MPGTGDPEMNSQPLCLWSLQPVALSPASLWGLFSKCKFPESHPHFSFFSLVEEFSIPTIGAEPFYLPPNISKLRLLITRGFTCARVVDFSLGPRPADSSEMDSTWPLESLTGKVGQNILLVGASWFWPIASLIQNCNSYSSALHRLLFKVLLPSLCLLIQ